ncbi:agmatinase [Isachenkonia alkalipeptolytica]|uniref:Agmatinase n=1 Tax=Isachenkonia alkalipeptolytica TaxID=2565777 RepID=A0AA43XNI1_9CLOT|nr:agmatinase [Isachenkonia alkalipeptolytica]NBG89439.1 agmatinase [Isachenkonia alkalipeptolytica]
MKIGELTETIAQQKKLWAGLNDPEGLMGEVDAALFGIPYDGGVSFRGGAAKGPQSVREITYTIAKTTEHLESFEGFRIRDLGDFYGGDRNRVFEDVRNLVETLIKKNQFFTMIGGDHSTTIPVLQGIDRAVGEEFGIIHIDAHLDLCDKMDGDSLSHGSTQRRALELDHISGMENLMFLGIRSIEDQEYDFLKDQNPSIITAYRMNQMGIKKVLEQVHEQMKNYKQIYVTIDIDALDPGFAAGTGTPQFGGLNSRQMLDLLMGIFELPILGFDVVEIAPELDPAKTASFAGRKIITECFGHHWRKTRGDKVLAKDRLHDRK